MVFDDFLRSLKRFKGKEILGNEVIKKGVQKESYYKYDHEKILIVMTSLLSSLST